MSWMWDLFSNEASVATAIFSLAATIVLGLAIGGIRCWGIRLGVAGVLFSGLLLGHLGMAILPEVEEFAHELGLVLFIYAIGSAVGPGFVNAIRAYGAKTNLFAVAIVASGVVLAGVGSMLLGIAPPIAVGILAGATTNTPSLAAAGSMLAEFPPDAAKARPALRQIGLNDAQLTDEAVRKEVGKLPGLGYAVTYPGGVCGIILAFLILKRIFRIDPVSDACSLEQHESPQRAELEHWAVRMTDSRCEGMAADQLPPHFGSSAVISRVRRGEQTTVCLGDTSLQVGDTLLIVGVLDELESLCRQLGERVEEAELSESPEIAARWIVVSKKTLAGRSLERLRIAERFQVRITRVRRGDTELPPAARLRLVIGDGIFAVGSAEGVAALAEEAGDTPREIEEPHLLSMFLGISLGVVLGCVPISIPGLAAPVKIGLAGGPLLVAIALSHLHRVGPFVFYLPRPANLALKEFGIAIFLAAVGLKSGNRFVETMTHGDGIWWMAWGVVVTLVPLLAIGSVCIGLFRIPYSAVMGVLAGSMTDPPALAFANSLTKSEIPAVAYATVYPTTMILRIVFAQLFLLAIG